MTTETPNTPKQAKGGTFAPADVDLIKKLIMAYGTGSRRALSNQEEQQAMNVWHRLGRIS